MGIGDLLTEPEQVKKEPDGGVKDTSKRKSWFTEVIDKTLTDGRKFYVPKSFQPSGISDCDRANCYFRIGIPTTQPSADAIKRMDTGTFLHEKWLSYFKRTGMLKNDDFKFPLEMFNPHIRAKVDAIIAFFDVEYYLVEIKYMGDDYFKDLKGIREYDYRQWQLYSHMSGVKVGCLLYNSFDPNKKPKIYELSYDELYIFELFGRLRKVEKAVYEDKIILPKQCHPHETRYRYCYYKKHCYSEEGDKI